MRSAEVTLPSDTEVCISRTFDAPAPLVWRTYTEPALLRRWMLGPPGWSMPVCEMDVQIGGQFRWRWRSNEDDKEFGFYGEFEEVSPYKKIIYTEIYDPGELGDNMGGSTLVTVTFDEHNGKTTMVTSIQFQSREDRETALSTGMTEGMEMSYKQLDTLLESEAV